MPGRRIPYAGTLLANPHKHDQRWSIFYSLLSLIIESSMYQVRMFHSKINGFGFSTYPAGLICSPFLPGVTQFPADFSACFNNRRTTFRMHLTEIIFFSMSLLRSNNFSSPGHVAGLYCPYRIYYPMIHVISIFLLSPPAIDPSM